MAKMTKEQKAQLEWYADLFGVMSDKVFNMADEELEVLSDAVEAVGTGNCWCMMFDAAKWLRSEIADQKIARAQRAPAVPNGDQGSAT